ncbi:MAG: imidazole glycerol phosphate synthase subunit HisH [Spirochaetales bacterium]
MSTGVIDYGAGNLKSVETALRAIGADFVVSSEPDAFSGCDRLIFPGVGDAAAAMQDMNSREMDTLLVEFAGAGLPVLGICLGAQIVLDRSQESDARCLGLIPGEARAFPQDSGYKVPHMGWNRLASRKNHLLFEGIPEDASFYFVHSYYPLPAGDEYVLATTEYIHQFASALQKGNVMAVQFHPEKSGRFGLRLLENFLSIS